MIFVESRPIILKVIVTDVSMLCNNFITERQNSEDFRLSIANMQSSSFLIDQKDRDHLTLCSKIVGHIMNHLFIRKVFLNKCFFVFIHSFLTRLRVILQ